MEAETKPKHEDAISRRRNNLNGAVLRDKLEKRGDGCLAQRSLEVLEPKFQHWFFFFDEGNPVMSNRAGLWSGQLVTVGTEFIF